MDFCVKENISSFVRVGYFQFLCLFVSVLIEGREFILKVLLRTNSSDQACCHSARGRDWLDQIHAVTGVPAGQSPACPLLLVCFSFDHWLDFLRKLVLFFICQEPSQKGLYSLAAAVLFLFPPLAFSFLCCSSLLVLLHAVFSSPCFTSVVGLPQMCCRGDSLFWERGGSSMTSWCTPH